MGRPKKQDIEAANLWEMPWNIQDWHTSKARMKLGYAAQALYREMLEFQWYHGHVPEDPEAVSRWTGQPVEDTRSLWPMVRPFFREQRGKLRHNSTHVRRQNRIKTKAARRDQQGKEKAKAAEESTRKTPRKHQENTTKAPGLHRGTRAESSSYRDQVPLPTPTPTPTIEDTQKESVCSTPYPGEGKANGNGHAFHVDELADWLRQRYRRDRLSSHGGEPWEMILGETIMDAETAEEVKTAFGHYQASEDYRRGIVMGLGRWLAEAWRNYRTGPVEGNGARSDAMARLDEIAKGDKS